tara:strand:+ start:365 stop:664 length:300 start_codon:yes stop_codon:yes gene_type:complete
MNDDILRAQINEIIKDEIQENINEYVDKKDSDKGKGFSGFAEKEDEKLKVNVPNREVDKLVKEYKRIKKYMKSSIHELKMLDGGDDDFVDKLLKDYGDS